MRPARIPLFPLEVVLLPSMPLPLHIFEPRYRKMIGWCLAEKQEFGMILSEDKETSEVGCTAEVVQKMKDYPDGRMDILAAGRAVFHVMELLDEKEYHEAIVEYLADEPDAPDARQEERLLEVFQRTHKTLFGEPWSPTEGESGYPLAYRMAARLPIPLPEKQQLLEMRNEGERQKFVLGWINNALPRLLRTQRVRQLAGGNGHGAP